MEILSQMTIFFFLLMLGVAGRLLGIINETIRQALTKIVVNLVTPCMLLACDLSAVIAQDLSFIGYAMLVMLLIQFSQIVSGFVVPWLMRYPKKDRGTVNMLFTCTNILLLGIPLVGALYGDLAIVYMSIAIVFNNFLLFSYGIVMVGGGRDQISFKHLITNPSFISSLLLVIFILTGFELPSGVRDALGRGGAAAPVLAMMIVGSAVPEIKFKETLRDYRLMIFVVVKMLIVPAVLLWALQWSFSSREFEGVALVILAGPSGVMTAVLAALYNPTMVAPAARAVSLTTAAAVFTIPLVAVITGIGL
ncbi:MAG: AEC family transporter [Succinatimonas sp.]|nr:AEC family transporter [Succinatimonas sp.]